ncbi:polygalacturonase PglA [Rhizobium sp. SL42]|uniref:polygalacturonase PglA n=1 Tax=Rhizobium sp. SL42 TaxID=2806346 RepID=UPI001F2F3037|nr:glycoside hydrolase family 28 protein [Rhizobium sp. SL42]UJW74853.1 glycoside hydrolase family 28 protein [Rhizobium sp. SL42]
MTSQFITLLTAGARTATLLIAPDRFLFARDGALDWQLSEGDGLVVATGQVHSVVLNLGNLEPGRHYRLETADGGFTFATANETALLDIRDFGASTESADNARAIQSAIASLPAGGTLRLPAGLWSSGPIFLKGEMTLLLEEGAILADTGSRRGRKVLPARHADGRVLGTWEGVAEPCFASLINAIDCDNLTITGHGTIDGGGDRGDWWTWPKETRDGARRPRTIFLSSCKHVILSGITVQNSPSWTVHPVLCDHLLAAGLTIRNDPLSPNTDGLNPEASSDIRLIGLDISVGDDCIAIKAGKRDPRGGPDRPTRRVEISNCLMQRGHGAVVMGSEMSRGIHDVSISRCHFVGTDRGLRIKTRRGRGGAVSDIHLSQCRMDDVATPIAVNAFYFCDADGRSEYVQSRNPLPLSIETPRISNITIRDVVVSGAETAAAVFYGLPECEIDAVSVDGLSIVYAEGAKPGLPEMACHLPQLLHAGIVAENTRFSLLARLSPHSIHPNL